MKKHCEHCNVEFDANRDTAKFCSPKCKTAHSRVSVTQGFSVTQQNKVSVTYQFTVGYNRKPGDLGYDEDVAQKRKQVREAVYWYDVPIAAIPVREKDWPEMPDYMNGRQYFLWWKNEFKTNDKGKPVILYPFKQYDKVTYEKAGEGSRRWGA